MNKKVTRTACAALVALSFVAAACGDDDEASSDTTADGGSDTTAGGDTSECAPNAEQPNAGKTVTIFSSIRPPEDALLAEAWSCFEQQSGITISHEGSGSFEADLKVRVDGGNAPDLAFIPQPGLVQTLAQGGNLVALSSLEDVAKNDYVAGWSDLGTVDGTFYAPPFGANVKSFVWYSPPKFAEAGYEVPETWEEMVALSDQIVADGGKPWCVAAGSDQATGWPLTDWMEDAVLRFAGPDIYDQWWSHEIPFNSPELVSALDKVGEIVKNEDYVYNGVGSIQGTTFQDGGLPLLDGGCYMYRQASFYGNQFPDGTTKGADGEINAFYLPVASAGDPKVMLGGGELIGSFNDKPETVEVATFLASADWANARMPLGNYFTANKNIDTSLITDPLERSFQEALIGADIFRFDASDLMPSAVGAGTFWTEMINWVSGDTSEEVLTGVEDTWPS